MSSFASASSASTASASATHLENMKTDDNGVLRFTMKGLNVSLANAIRRTILSDIKLIVFKTFPYEKNKSKFVVNTSSLTNEIIKQRLSCIPVHADPKTFHYEAFYLALSVENNTNEVLHVTSNDFVVKRKADDSVFSELDMFPMYHSEWGIDLVRLRPQISDSLIGEKLEFTCDFSIGTAKEDGCFNAASTCSYSFTEDFVAQAERLVELQAIWEKEKKDVDMETKNWRLLEARRITIPNSFDFVVQSECVYSNGELIVTACDILIEKLKTQSELNETGELKIMKSANTMKHSFDIILENEDYTIGKTLEYMFYSKYFENPHQQALAFCGFKKIHPHDTFSIIRISILDSVVLADDRVEAQIRHYLADCIQSAAAAFQLIKTKFIALDEMKSV